MAIDKMAMDTKESQIVFLPSGKRGVFANGTTILSAARSLGVDLDSVCGGRGICGRCQIEITQGQFAKFGISSLTANASAFSKVEQRYKDKRNLKPNRRLGCSTKILNDLVIDVPSESQLHRQIIRKELTLRDINLAVATRLYMLEVEKPDMNNPSSHIERIYKALYEQWDVTVHHCDLHIMQNISDVLIKGKGNITVAVNDPCPDNLPRENHSKYGPKTIIAAWSDYHESAYGLAIDIGSTTIAAHLCDLSNGNILSSGGIMNPQIRFGEDLMSRVSFVMMNEGGEKELTEAVRSAVNQLAIDITHKIGGDVNNILEVCIVGNPIMHHLFLGINPVELGVAPFAMTTGLEVNCLARDVDLHFNTGARFFALPCIAGHVGADAAAATLCEVPYKSDEVRLIVDIGTNAEIILGNKTKLLAASSPTGPAFEGAQISCGQRAAAGAIERIRIDKDTLEARFKVIGCDLWSDEEGFEEEVSTVGVTGICGSAIIEVIGEMFLAGIINEDGLMNASYIDKTWRIVQEERTYNYIVYQGKQEIVVKQSDIRAIQLAKAALYAGAKLLMDKMGVPKVDSITLAGAFGSHIDKKYAMLLGLIPDCAEDAVRAVGNAAGTGAVTALLDKNSRYEITEIIHTIEKIETAVEADFQTYFIDAMSIPNKKDETPHLKEIFTLPEKEAFSSEGTVHKARRRKKR